MRYRDSIDSTKRSWCQGDESAFIPEARKARSTVVYLHCISAPCRLGPGGPSSPSLHPDFETLLCAYINSLIFKPHYFPLCFYCAFYCGGGEWINSVTVLLVMRVQLRATARATGRSKPIIRFLRPRKNSHKYNTHFQDNTVRSVVH